MKSTKNPSFSFDEFTKNFHSTLEPYVQHHLKQVYSCLTMATLAAAAGAYVYLFINSPLFLCSLISIAAIGFLFSLLATPNENGKKRRNVTTHIGVLLGCAFFLGLSLGPLLESAIAINPAIIPAAFLGTSVIFVCYTLCSLLSPRGQDLFLGAPLLSMLWLLILLPLGNIFIESYLIYEMSLYAAFAITCAFVLYDTQLIITRRRMGDKDYVWHSLVLFIDFFKIFRDLLILLARKEEENKKRRKNKRMYCPVEQCHLNEKLAGNNKRNV